MLIFIGCFVFCFVDRFTVWNYSFFFVINDNLWCYIMTPASFRHQWQFLVLHHDSSFLASFFLSNSFSDLCGASPILAKSPLLRFSFFSLSCFTNHPLMAVTSKVLYIPATSLPHTSHRNLYYIFSSFFFLFTPMHLNFCKSFYICPRCLDRNNLSIQLHMLSILVLSSSHVVTLSSVPNMMPSFMLTTKYHPPTPFTQPTISTLHPAQSPLSPSSTSLPCHPAAPHVRLDICFPARQCVRSGLDICVSCLGWMFVCQVWARCLCVRSGLDVFLFSNTSRIVSYTSPNIHRRLSHFSLFLFLSKTAWLTLALYVRSVRFFVSFWRVDGGY